MITEYLQDRHLESLRKELAGLLNDGVPPDFDQSWEDRAKFRHEVLSWCVRMSGGVSVQWEALEKTGGVKQLDREKYVFALWDHLTLHENKEWRDLIKNRLGSWEIYRGFLSAWFLSRFNLSAARALASRREVPSVLRPGLVELIGLSFAFAASLLLALWLTWFDRLSAWTFLAGVAAALLVFGCGKLAVGVRLRPFLHLLLPRLAASVGIGYMALAAATDLMRMIYRTGSGIFPYILSLLLIAGCFAFTMLHVDRRVAPALRGPDLLRRSASVLAMGIGHTATGLALFSPLLFHPRFLGLSSVNPCPGQLVLTAAVALSLGVALQLVWEEKSLTEPL